MLQHLNAYTIIKLYACNVMTYLHYFGNFVVLVLYINSELTIIIYHICTVWLMVFIINRQKQKIVL